MVINPIVGVYIPIIRIPIEGGMKHGFTFGHQGILQGQLPREVDAAFQKCFHSDAGIKELLGGDMLQFDVQNVQFLTTM